jgi:hypothetical protein
MWWSERAADNMARACCMLDKWGCVHVHTHTHSEMCNTYCFSTAKVVLWTRLSVTFYAHCLSWYTGYTQKNGAVSKVNEKFISHLTRAQCTSSAAATVQVSHALPAGHSSCLLRAMEPVFRMASQQEMAYDHLLPWPPRSPDLTPCDFFLWGFVKDSVYVPPLPVSLRKLRYWITHALQAITADMLHQVWDKFHYCVDVCHVSQGAHIEGLWVAHEKLG